MNSDALQALTWIFQGIASIFNMWAGLSVLNMFLGLCILSLILKIYDLFR